MLWVANYGHMKEIDSIPNYWLPSTNLSARMNATVVHRRTASSSSVDNSSNIVRGKALHYRSENSLSHSDSGALKGRRQHALEEDAEKQQLHEMKNLHDSENSGNDNNFRDKRPIDGPTMDFLVFTRVDSQLVVHRTPGERYCSKSLIWHYWATLWLPYTLLNRFHCLKLFNVIRRFQCKLVSNRSDHLSTTAINFHASYYWAFTRFLVKRISSVFPLHPLISNEHDSFHHVWSRLRNPERLNLDRRDLDACPLLQHEDKLRLLNYQNNNITTIANLENLPQLIFLDFYNNNLRSLDGPLPWVPGRLWT